MDSNTLLAMGVVKLKNPRTNEVKLVEVRGFDILGFFFPFLRLLFAGMWGRAALCFFSSFLIVPYFIWAWYMGFKFTSINFQQHLKDGWVQDKAA